VENSKIYVKLLYLLKEERLYLFWKTKGRARILNVIRFCKIQILSRFNAPNLTKFEIIIWGTIMEMWRHNIFLSEHDFIKVLLWTICENFFIILLFYQKFYSIYSFQLFYTAKYCIFASCVVKLSIMGIIQIQLLETFTECVKQYEPRAKKVNTHII